MTAAAVSRDYSVVVDPVSGIPVRAATEFERDRTLPLVPETIPRA